MVRNPDIELYELIKRRTDSQTAHEAINAFQGTVNNRITGKITTAVDALERKMLERLNTYELQFEKRFNDFELKLTSLERDMIDRINSSKTQTILWVVGVGVLQLVARYLFK